MTEVIDKLRAYIVATRAIGTYDELLEQAANKIGMLTTEIQRHNESAERAWQISREAAAERDLLRKKVAYLENLVVQLSQRVDEPPPPTLTTRL